MIEIDQVATEVVVHLEKEVLVVGIEVVSEVETAEKVVDQKCMLLPAVNVVTHVKFHSDLPELDLFSAATALANRKARKAKVLVVDHEKEVLIAHDSKINDLTFARHQLRIIKQ